MKLLYVVALLAFFGCKTKAVSTEKSKSVNLESLVKRLDSMFEKQTKTQLEQHQKQSLIKANLQLTSVNQFDSLGHRKPFHYKHYIDGELQEEIYLEGGTINTNREETKSESSHINNSQTSEKTKATIDLNQKKSKKKIDKNKTKKAKINGFQFGFYVWLFFIIIALVVLIWAAKKFKLPDRFKTFLKGGKKKSYNL